MAFRLGVVLSGVVVIVAVVVGGWGYSANRGDEDADLWLGMGIYGAAIGLAFIWICVGVFYGLAKLAGVSRDRLP